MTATHRPGEAPRHAATMKEHQMSVFFAMSYTATMRDGSSQDIVLSGLSPAGVADTLRLLARANARAEVHVPTAKIYTMAGECVGQPSAPVFATLARGIDNYGIRY